MNKFDLEDRLIKFAVLNIKIAESITNSKTGYHLADQLLRSGTSSALNYGEAQSGESRKDFIHKIKIVLKELRESLICLKIIQYSGISKTESLITEAILENNELISIFVKSCETAQRNNDNSTPFKSKIINR